MTALESVAIGASTFARAGRTVVDRDSKAYAFTELEGLQMFRRQLEDFLLETGWSSFRADDGRETN